MLAVPHGVTVVNRRHHCRLCLQVLCDTCSPQRLVRHWDSPTSNSDTDISAAAAADGEASNAAAGQQAGGMPVAATASADASVSTTTSSIITSGDDMASIRVQQHAEYKLKADPRSRWGGFVLPPSIAVLTYIYRYIYIYRERYIYITLYSNQRGSH